MSSLSKGRMVFIVLLLFAAAAAILVRLFILLAESDTASADSPPGNIERGAILDRNGKVFAAQTRRYDIWVVVPKDLNNIKRQEKIYNLAVDLAPILNMHVDAVAGRINEERNDFVIKKQAMPEVYDQIRHIQDQRAGKLVGVIPRPVPARIYPEKSLAAQIIGFTGAQNIGREGIEYAFNTELSGERTGGRGDKVVLTIDANVQYILEQVAYNTLKETHAESVFFLAMDPRNGEILGSAIVPGYDPNNYSAYVPYDYQNLAAIPPYEPGSVFKAFSIAALMDSGAISENTAFDCPGYYERTFSGGEKVRIECADGNAHGRVRAREIIQYSCNVGAIYAAERLDSELFYQSLLNMGFGRATGAWVNTEAAGILKNPAVWSGRTKQSIAFGQEIAVSALQVMQAASIIANNGVLVPPKMVSHLESADGRTNRPWQNPAGPGRQVIRPETARRVLSYMADAASPNGTGWRANVDGLLAVKTGTSQYRDPVTRRYSRTDFIASCVAILPYKSPSLVLYVVILKPRGETYGGRIAAPAIHDAANRLIDYLGIPRPDNELVSVDGTIDITPEQLPALGHHVPNYYGYPKRTLLPLLDRNDIAVEIRGEGWVKKQSPPPGTAVTHGMTLLLELE